MQARSRSEVKASVMVEATPQGTGFANAVSLVASVVAAWLALFYAGCQLGVSEPAAPWLVSVGLSWFLVNAGFGVRSVVASLRGRVPETWLLGEAPLSVLALLVLTCLGALTGGRAAVPAAACGAIFFLIRAARALPSMRWGSAVAALLGSVFVALVVGSVVWGDNHLNPLVVPGLSFGFGYIDELFHAGMANMIRTYGVPSIGLDGLVYCPYHYGSHFLFAHLSELLQLPVIDFYQLGFPVLFLPWFIHAVGLATEAFLSGKAVPGGPISPIRLSVSLVLLLLALGGFVPFSSALLLNYLLNGIGSESMNIALAVLLFALAAGWPIFLRGLGSAGSLPWADAVAAALAFPLLVVGLTFLKISVGSVLLAVACLLFVRTGLWRRSRLGWCSVTAACLAFLLVVPLVAGLTARKDAQSITPLAYLRDYVAPNSWLFHLLLQYSWVLVFLVLRVRQAGVKTVGDLLEALRRRNLVDLEFLLLMALVGSVPGFFLRVSNGGAMYFFNIQRWVALPMLLALSLSWPVMAPQTMLSSWRDRLRAMPVALWLGCLLLGVAVGTCLLNTWYGYTPAMIDDNLKRRGFFMPQDGTDQAAGMRVTVEEAFVAGRFWDAWQLVEEGTRAADNRTDPRHAVVQILRSIDRLPPSEKRVTALYVPKRNGAYWRMLPDVRATPFLGPAVAGIAMIDGLPTPQPGVVFEGYGYEPYDLTRAQPAIADADLEKKHVTEKARRMGFARVLVIDSGKDGSPFVLEWCLGDARPVWSGRKTP
jgi:hypothetical protein